MTLIPASATDLSSARVNWFRVLRAEWRKFRSIRSTYVLVAITLVVLIGMWAIVSAGFAFDESEGGPPPGIREALNPVAISLRVSIMLTQLVVGVMGVLIVTNEYSTGMIRSTLAAVPRRIPVLTAKAVLLILVVVVVTLPAIFAAFFIGDAMLSTANLGLALNEPDVLRALVGGSLYMAGVGIFGSILGWLLRSAAGAIATLVGVIILLPVLLPLIPLGWVDTASEYLPSTVGQRIFMLSSVLDELTNQVDVDPVTGFGIFTAYAIAGLVISAWVLKRRDA